MYLDAIFEVDIFKSGLDKKLFYLPYYAVNSCPDRNTIRFGGIYSVKDRAALAKLIVQYAKNERLNVKFKRGK